MFIAVSQIPIWAFIAVKEQTGATIFEVNTLKHISLMDQGALNQEAHTLGIVTKRLLLKL